MSTGLLERDAGANADTDLEIINEEQLDRPPLCESTDCANRGRGTHEAHYIVNTRCGACHLVYLVCRTRVEKYATDVWIICKCDTRVPVVGMVVTPL